jgi:hypothetical protein
MTERPPLFIVATCQNPHKSVSFGIMMGTK